MTTGWVYHELYMWHDTGRATTASPNRKWMQAWEHYENPEAKRRFRNLVEVAGLFNDLVALQPRAATVDEILRFHTPAYVESIRAMSDASGGTPASSRRSGPVPSRSRCWRRAARSRPSMPSSTGACEMPTPWCGRPATMPRPTAVEGSASSETSWWPSSTRE